MSDWDEYAAKYGLETGAGYKEVFLKHIHFDKDKPMLLNHFSKDKTYVTFDEALNAIKLAEEALKVKYDIK
tara:strand:+ start:670 stop:882 length:213 start_codon:yes stop_codon:yes gene_type:complete